MSNKFIEQMRAYAAFRQTHEEANVDLRERLKFYEKNDNANKNNEFSCNVKDK